MSLHIPFLSNIFAGFKSRCEISFQLRQLQPQMISLMSVSAQFSGMVLLFFIKCIKSPCQQCYVMMYMLLAVWKTSRSLTILGWCSFFMIYISEQIFFTLQLFVNNFLFITLIATVSLESIVLPLQTFAYDPLPSRLFCLKAYFSIFFYPFGFIGLTDNIIIKLTPQFITHYITLILLITYLIMTQALTQAQMQKHPLNTSSAKYQFAFPKDTRFKNSQPLSYPLIRCHNLYNTALHFSKRSTAIGYGKKTDFLPNLNTSPPPSAYHLDSIFGNTKKGYSFGSRQTSFLDYSRINDRNNPSPLHYQNKSLDRNNFQFSMRHKTIDLQRKNNSSMYTPGPAAYELISTYQKKGNNSKFSSVKKAVLNTTSQRFLSEKCTAGPGDYKGYIDQLSNQNTMVQSKYKSNVRQKFERKKKRTFFDEVQRNSNKWPGSYRGVSDFNYYQKKVNG